MLPGAPKVCHIIHHDGPGGGPMALLDQLVTGAGHFELSVIHGGSGQIAAYCEAHNIPHWQVSIETLGAIPFGFLPLVFALRKAAPDVVILHGQWAAPVGALALRLAGIRHSIYLCQWPSFYTDWDSWRVLRNHVAEAIPCRICDRVVPVSRGSWYQYSLRRLGEGKLRIIHNGIDLGRIPTPAQGHAVREANGWSDAHCHVVSVGRLADQKRVDWLLRSWRLVQDQAPEARLWIIGAGREEAALRRLAGQLGLEKTCGFLGMRPNGLEYIVASDLVAMTTLYEAHAIIPLEALAAGRPVVANDVDGVEDSIEDGVEGFLVHPGDIETFAEKLLLLIRDPVLREKMGDAGRRRAPRFSVENTNAAYRDLIREVLAPASLRP